MSESKRIRLKGQPQPSNDHPIMNVRPEQVIQQAPPTIAGLKQRAHNDLHSLSSHEMQFLQRTIGNRAVAQLFKGNTQRENVTSLPSTLKAGVENLSDLSMDDVQVHYNSPQPAHMQALAYTQGTDIHVGPGQEQHLAHEAWHVVQQKQRRVKPTLQAKGVAMNDNQGLEKEADVMGARANTPQSRIVQKRQPSPSLIETDALPVTEEVPAIRGQSQEPYVIQAKIDRMPHHYFNIFRQETYTQQQITKYMNAEKINSRGQTFGEAVMEFISLFPKESRERGVTNLWEQLSIILGQGNTHRAISDLNTIASQINQVAALYPGYPNRNLGASVGSDLPDQPFTIPQSELTIDMATRLHSWLVGAQILKPDDQGYMIGVLQTPSGLFATCSGKAPDGFKSIVKRLGMKFVEVYHGKVEESTQLVAQALPKQAHALKVTTLPDSDLQVVSSATEMGGPIGLCAAPKLIWHMILSVKEKPVAMTEVLVAPQHKPEPLIESAEGQIIKYRNTDRVPSCLSCQILLEELNQKVEEAIHEHLRERLLLEEYERHERLRREASAAQAAVYGEEELADDSDEVIRVRKLLAILMDKIANEQVVKNDPDLFIDYQKKQQLDRNLDNLAWHLQALLHLPASSRKRKDLDEMRNQLENMNKLAGRFIEELEVFWKKNPL